MRKTYEIDCDWLDATGERYRAESAREALLKFERAHGSLVGFWIMDEGHTHDGEEWAMASFQGQTWSNGDWNPESVSATEVLNLHEIGF